jgi:hypothetical protein
VDRDRGAQPHRYHPLPFGLAIILFQCLLICVRLNV